MYCGTSCGSSLMGTAELESEGAGARLRHIRSRESQVDFAIRHGIGHATYRNYESGFRHPSPEFLVSLIRSGWNANWVLTGEGPERLPAGGRVSEEPASYASSQELSEETLSIALELTEEVLHGKWLPKREYAQVVAGIYAMLAQGLPYADILEMTRSPAETKAKQGAGDGSRSEGDPPGEGADRRSGNR